MNSNFHGVKLLIFNYRFVHISCSTLAITARILIDLEIFFHQLEKLISKNYFLNQSAKEAFKSYVRAYDSHQLKTIFNVNTLDLAKVALSFGFTVPPVVDLSEYTETHLTIDCMYFSLNKIHISIISKQK